MKYPKLEIRYLIYFLLINNLFISCIEVNSKEVKTEQETVIDAREDENDEIPVYDFAALEPLLYSNSDKIQLVNFWAMWCKPCVEELPYIEAYAKKNSNVEVLLISLDFPDEIETKLKPFLAEKNIKSKVILLDDPDANSWIDKINPNWSGAIPYTIIYNQKERLFYEREFEDIKDLENEVNKILN